MAASLKITKLPFINTLVIKQEEIKFFIGTKNSFVIDIEGFLLILKFIVDSGIISREQVERTINEKTDTIA